jgi:lycopene beta-cyclase
LRPDQYRLNATIRGVGANRVVLAGGERLEADAVIDARGGGVGQGLDLCWQKFVGRVFDFASGHGIARPVIMDARVDQLDGYRFLYFLPLSRSRLLIEDTYYSPSPSLDLDLIEGRIGAIALRLRSGAFETVEQESGVLPVVLDGDFDQFWPQQDELPRLGVRGGFFHPTTSYSLPDAVANAAILAEQADFAPEALVRLMRTRAERLWRDRSFYRLLNRMLFRAAEPGHAYKVLEHFYRLPEGLVSRFYAARLTAFDKVRILSGRPPVPIGRALMAMRRTAA